MSNIKERTGRFLKNLGVAAGHCALEDGEIAVTVLFFFAGVGLLMFLALLFTGALRVGYELIFDPNSVDVSFRLACLSIEPSKWI